MLLLICTLFNEALQIREGVVTKISSFDSTVDTILNFCFCAVICVL
jgi:hypothetical protein